MTQLPHNLQIWVEDLPEDATALVKINPTRPILQWKEKGFEHKPYWTTKHLPPGTWKLICLGNQATEEEAREIVEGLFGKHWFDYMNPNEGSYAPGYIFDTALQSLASLITANGWKTPVFLWKEN